MVSQSNWKWWRDSNDFYQRIVSLEHDFKGSRETCTINIEKCYGREDQFR
jgi:hypothetical protein